MSAALLAWPGTRSERLRDVAIHLSVLAPMAVIALVVGRPALWAAPLLPVGPLVLGRLLSGTRPLALEHRARAIDLTASVAAYALGLYLVLSVGAGVEALAVLLPVGAILLLLLILNWVLVTLVAVNRARYGELFDPPWVLALPAWLRGAERAEPSTKET